jgi:hypothetical protein
VSTLLATQECSAFRTSKDKRKFKGRVKRFFKYSAPYVPG